MSSRQPTPTLPLSAAARRAKKRPATPVLGGQDGSYSNVDTDFTCPICLGVIDEAYMTKCGHSFCHTCIQRSLERNNRCPKCGGLHESPNDIFPNITLTNVLRKHRAEKKNCVEKQLSQPQGSLPRVSHDLDLVDINNIISKLNTRRQLLEQGSQLAQARMLKYFLDEVRMRKEKEQEEIQRQLDFLKQDCKAADEKIAMYEQQNLDCRVSDHLVPNGSLSENIDIKSETSGGADSRTTSPTSPSPSGVAEPFAGTTTIKPTLEMSEARRKRKLNMHFEDLERVYLDSKTTADLGGETCNKLESFSTCLSKFCKYTSVRAVASLNYTHDVFTNSSSIVSSIEFDRDSEFFAIAGVTKKIKVFEYQIVRNAIVDLHYPVTEMLCESKISCIAWNPYKKHMLSSADYNGIVYMWDTATNQNTQMFQEHEKRCWSVDFNTMDPKMLASGSDDTKVKLWDWDRPQSVMTIEGGANVCCVQFNPTTRYNLAFGSADHCVHYYDLRHPKKAMQILRGHGKAVSYVKFLNGNDMVSASTDSQLKMWSLGSDNATSTLKGHINEKNFVGLATDGDYIACGSENNSLFVYYKGLSKHMLTYKFEPARRLLTKPTKDEDSAEFVSAVTWKPNSNVLVAANSQGLVKLLELV